jgi:hypothetical protein
LLPVGGLGVEWDSVETLVEIDVAADFISAVDFVFISFHFD